MPQTPRQTPANSGPGRGTPRARTTARPGERSARPSVKPLEPQDVGKAMSDRPAPLPRAQRALTATWRLIVLLAVIAGIGLVLAHSLRVYFAQRAEIADLKVQIAEEKANIADLNDQLERWNDPEYVRAIARERLGWVMPGEVGYHVLGADGKPLDGATIDSGEEEHAGPWWERMWGSVQTADQLVEEDTPANTPDPDRIIEPSPTASPSTEG